RIGQAAKPSVPEVAAEPVQIAENSSDSNPLGTPAERQKLASVEECVPRTETVQNPNDEVLMRSSKEDAATHHDAAECNADVSQLLRHTHGGALPR
ncbi:MAG: hypothetical protein ACXWC1_34415, partial [Burkholderiales bacterium]